MAVAVFVVVVVVVGLGVLIADRRFQTPTDSGQPAATLPSPEPTPVAPDTAPEMAKASAHLPAGSISVAALNLHTGAASAYGSKGDHVSASVVKVDIIETLMLEHQESGEPLSENESYNATVMIVTSDNDSATRLYHDVGGAHGVRAANQTLGLKCTEPDPEYWGLTATCAEDQVRLLYQLKNDSSPLLPPSRDYILKLMQNVTPTQRWGVPTVADPDTTFAVKNGWLDLEEGTDWVINSMGIVTYHGQTLLIATLSQHNESMASGVSLDQQLAKLAAESVTVP